MVNKKIVYEALERSQELESMKPAAKAKIQDILISLLIHDIFGGEILKTHKRKNWHYYNRIDGERIDFTKTRKSAGATFEDIPATPDETFNFVDQADYSNFFMRFVRAFEETVGLDRYRVEFSA
jgi:hypothetical protein